MTGSVVTGRTNGASGVERVVFNDKMWETRREMFLARTGGLARYGRGASW